MPQANHRSGRGWRRRAVTARDEREVVDLEALTGNGARRSTDDEGDRIAVVLGAQRYLRQRRPLRAGQRAIVALLDERPPAGELLQQQADALARSVAAHDAVRRVHEPGARIEDGARTRRQLVGASSRVQGEATSVAVAGAVARDR